MELVPPVHVQLAQRPTPLMPLERTSQQLGLELWVKRDDLTGVALSGNKVRKLEFLVAEALGQGADTLITCGAMTSNHARATAVAGARFGLRVQLLLRGAKPSHPQGNLLLDEYFGAEVLPIRPSEWAERTSRMAAMADAERAEGRHAYVIPEGGSNAVGSMGYAILAEELIVQEEQLGLRIGRIVHACGSGGTTAGLALGLAAHGREDVDVVGVAVCDDAAYFDGVIRRICAECVELGHLPSEIAERARWRILDRYKGRGYAKTSRAELDAQRALARREGLIVDPVYTGKAYGALCAEAAAGRLSGSGATVFLHTGGIFGLFHFAEVLAATANDDQPTGG